REELHPSSRLVKLMRLVSLMFFILYSLSSFGGDWNFTFRFSSNHTNDHFTVGNNLLNFRDWSGSSDWISVSFTENYQSVYFYAKRPETFQNRKSIMFTVNYDGSNVFGYAVMEPRIYRFVCQWDDEGLINEDEDYSASLLHDYEGFSNLGVDGGDQDKWIFVPQKQGYCFEVTATNNFLLEARQNGNELNEPESVISPQPGNLFSKRLYVTNALLDRPIDFIVSRPENAENKTIGYRFSLKPIRPLVLVHGIRSPPTWHGDKYTSFGDLKAKASKYGDFPPCMVFDFPWDSNKGSITDYCGGKGNFNYLYGFANKHCGDWKLKPVFFAHSMGGLLFIEQMKNNEFRETVGGAIFAGSPFCGSDIANVLLQTDIGSKVKIGADLLNKTQTTTENFKLLARGSKSISERLKKINVNFPVLFLVGGYVDDLITGHGDKRVNVSSASLYNTLAFSNEDHLVVGMEHGELVDITLPPSQKYENICAKLIKMLEH
ncbi:hypothetical protein IKZ80_07075, partial [bacterium]|nr:hypothetical protein [bacterium]